MGVLRCIHPLGWLGRSGGALVIGIILAVTKWKKPSVEDESLKKEAQ